MSNTTTAPLPFGSPLFAARRAADVIAILQGTEKGSYQEVLKRLNKALVTYGEHDPVTPEELDDLKTVTRKLHEVFTISGTDKVAASLNDILAELATAPRLSRHDGTAWHLHVDSGDHAPWAEWFAASSALALAILLAEKGRNPCGLCASEACKRPFIDIGKGGGRNYCSPRCATRERVAAYRRRAA